MSGHDLCQGQLLVISFAVVITDSCIYMAYPRVYNIIYMAAMHAIIQV